MSARDAALAAALALCAVLAACAPGSPTSCDEAGCVRRTQLCRLFGSDTLAPSTALCEALPAACVDGLTCDCLLAAAPEGSIAVCKDLGPPDAVAVVVPGG